MNPVRWMVLGVALLTGACAEMRLPPFPVPAEPAPKTEPAPKPEPAPKVEKSVRSEMPAPEPSPEAVKRQPNELEQLLTYYDHVRKLQPAELSKEQETVRQAFAKDKSDLSRMRLALIQAMPGSAVRNDAGAQALLEPVLKDGSIRDAGLRAFAMLLSAYLAEHKRYEDRLRDDQKQIEDLNAKIEALTSIEKSLMERGQKGTAPRK